MHIAQLRNCSMQLFHLHSQLVNSILKSHPITFKRNTIYEILSDYSAKVVFHTRRNNYNDVHNDELYIQRITCLIKKNVRDTFRIFPKFKEMI